MALIRERGASTISKLHFPGLDPTAARWLVKNRRVAAIGLDTPSIDYGQSDLFERNIPAFENLDELGSLPPTGTFIIALPMKIRNGSASSDCRHRAKRPGTLKGQV